MGKKILGEFDESEFSPLEDDDNPDRHYFATQTLEEFHADDSFVRGVMGPVGSGKSVGMVCEGLQRACKQRPFHGVRRTRWAIIRNTYGELASTTLNTFKDWIPNSMCRVKESPPIVAYIDAYLEDGTKVESEILFVALDRPDQVKKLLSLEITWAWINEGKEVPKEVLDMLKKRVGRYPGPALGGASWWGVFMDTNPPDDDHWYYKLAEEERPEGWTFYRQPGGLLRDEQGNYSPNPLAENVQNLPGGYNYYFTQIAGEEQPSIDAYVLGQYASLHTGRAVYQGQWYDTWHLSHEPLPVFNGIPLRLGFDFGLTPACAVGQVTPMGGLNILREYYAENEGLRQFVMEIVKPSLLNDFPHIPQSKWLVTGDPRGDQRSQANKNAPNCFKELSLAGMPGRPAPTNDFEMRRQAVINMLRRTLGPGEAAFRLDPSCKILRKGFNGGFQFRRMQVSSSTGPVYTDKPVKNRYSHLQDGLQYLCLQVERPADITPPGGARHRHNLPPQHNTWPGTT